MDIEIPCELYQRFAAIPLSLDPEYKHQYLKCLFFERINNKLFIVASNGYIAAIEFIGPNDGPDDYCAIVVDASIVAQCERELLHNGQMTINANLDLKYAGITTTFGYKYPANAHFELPDANHFHRWREWLPDEMPKKTIGAMRWSCDEIYRLGLSSPSQVIRFPQFIDTNVPILICDHETDRWIGLFLGSGRKEKVIPSQIPNWIDRATET